MRADLYRFVFKGSGTAFPAVLFGSSEPDAIRNLHAVAARDGLTIEAIESVKEDGRAAICEAHGKPLIWQWPTGAHTDWMGCEECAHGKEGARPLYVGP